MLFVSRSVRGSWPIITPKYSAMGVHASSFSVRQPTARPPLGSGVGAGQNQQKRKPGINENYARELMELHTLGVDGGYTQKDVQEVARCFTGWTIDRPRMVARFVFRPNIHDDGEKTVLGHKIPAGGGERDGEMVIDILAHHPSTARFISTAMARRFISDNPPQPLVDRLAKVYMQTGGDIREMMHTILTSPEFYSVEAYRAKIKSPFELAASAIRAMGGDTDGSPALAQFVARMGEPLYRYQAPTGYPDRASQWVNSGALLQRVNFSLALSANKIPGTAVRLSSDLSQPATGPQLMDRAIAELLAGDVTQQTRTILEKQFADETFTGNPQPDGIEATPVSAEGPGMQRDPSERNEMTPIGPGRRGSNGRGPVEDWPIVVNKSGGAPDPMLAKAFGLVLGSPEFQRR